MVIALRDKAVFIFMLEPAVASRPQPVGMEQSSIGPVPHCVGMNMKQMSYLGSSQHPRISFHHISTPVSSQNII